MFFMHSTKTSIAFGGLICALYAIHSYFPAKRHETAVLKNKKTKKKQNTS